MPHHWTHSRSGWTGLWATWSTWRCPCSLQEGWARWPLSVPSKPNYPMIPWVIIVMLFRVACNPCTAMSWTGPLFPQKRRQSYAYPLFNKTCRIRSESKVTDFTHFLSLINQSSHPPCHTVCYVAFHFYRKLKTAKKQVAFFFFPTRDAQFSLQGRESRNSRLRIVTFTVITTIFRHRCTQFCGNPVLWGPHKLFYSSRKYPCTWPEVWARV